MINLEVLNNEDYILSVSDIKLLLAYIDDILSDEDCAEVEDLLDDMEKFVEECDANLD